MEKEWTAAERRISRWMSQQALFRNEDVFPRHMARRTGKNLAQILRKYRWSNTLRQNLPEYMWRMKVQREGGDHFFEFLKILANKQLQEDNFEVHEVISSLMY